MKRVNFEFKARLKREAHVRAALKKLRARYVGMDHQVDTYFRVPAGRLKVREGRIENALIFYERADQPRARRSRIQLMPLSRRNAVKAVLAAALGVRAVVNKRREIYFVGNVKVHLDRVRGLGKFLEVEAIGKSPGRRRRPEGHEFRDQARRFQRLFLIKDSEILAESYSDLILRKRNR